MFSLRLFAFKSDLLSGLNLIFTSIFSEYCILCYIVKVPKKKAEPADDGYKQQSAD